MKCRAAETSARAAIAGMGEGSRQSGRRDTVEMWTRDRCTESRPELLPGTEGELRALRNSFQVQRVS